jgi:Tetratricopeptide repeat
LSARLAGIAIAVASLAGCALGPAYGPAPGGIGGTAAPGESQAAVGADAPGVPAGGAADRSGSNRNAGLPDTSPSTANATAALLAQSRNARAAGNLDSAAATVERALAIAPDDALLWIELAEIRMDQGDTRNAEEMARKALTLTGNDAALAARARRLLGR